jgi:hypothetical protein
MRKGHAGLWVVILAVVAGACSSSAGKGAAMPAPAVQPDRLDKVLPLARDEEGPALLVDMDDADTVYLAEVEMLSGACKFYTSTDRGATWRAENAPVLDPFTKNCAMGLASSQNLRDELTQGPDGTIYWVFQANNPQLGGTRSVMIARTNDGGRSWQTVPIDAGTPPPEAGQSLEVNFEGHIAIDPANPKHIYAMWRQSYNRFPTSLPTRPFMAVSNDGGATWSPPQKMFDRALGFDGPRPVVVGTKLFAFWREAAPTPNGTAPLPAPPTTKLWASVSTDQGRTWTDHLIAEANDASEPVPLYDRKAGVFHVVWHDNRQNELDVYYSSSKDGTSWAQPKLLNDDPRRTRVGQHYPQISEAPNGRLDVAWYDWRDDPFPPPTVGNGQTLSLFTDRGKVASVYMTSSRDGGKTWTKNVKVNDTPIDRTIGTWENNFDVMAPVAISSSNAAAVVAWSDTRNGNALNNTQDIVTSTVTFGKAKAHRVTGFEAGLAGVLFGLGLAMCLAVLLVRRQSAQPPAPARPLNERERVF